MKCFNAPLQPSEVIGVKKVVSEKMAEGVSNDGLTLTGFLYLHALFIERGRLETTWTVLRKFGYNDEIELRDDVLLCPSLKRAPDQVLGMQLQVENQNLASPAMKQLSFYVHKFGRRLLLFHCSL